MYFECQECKQRKNEICMLDGGYAEPNHIYAIHHCDKLPANLEKKSKK